MRDTPILQNGSRTFFDKYSLLIVEMIGIALFIYYRFTNSAVGFEVEINHNISFGVGVLFAIITLLIAGAKLRRKELTALEAIGALIVLGLFASSYLQILAQQRELLQ